MELFFIAKACAAFFIPHATIEKDEYIQDHQDCQKNSMSLDQCIASLARVERGAIRDSKQDRIHFSLSPLPTPFKRG